MLASLAKKIKGFEKRDGQAEMAEAVHHALETGEHLAVEAPCGIGKTFAYLVPAIRYAIEQKTRVVVCTANIALQEQIFEKDLPVLSKALEEPFRYALIKGIGNYLCLDRYHETREGLSRATFDRREAGHWKKLSGWVNETKTGDRSDLSFEPAPGVWGRVNGSADLCTGSDCYYYDDCFAMASRHRLRSAQIIVTNYHLFFAHLRLKAAAQRDVVLPSYSAVICDEAHEMADITREFFGLRLGPTSIYPLIRGANQFKLSQLSDRLRGASGAFFGDVDRFAQSSSYKNRIRNPEFANGTDLSNVLSEYQSTLLDLKQSSESDVEADKVQKYLNAGQHYAETLQGFLQMEDQKMVYWIEREGRLASRLIDPSDILKTTLFEPNTAVLTSATLAPFELLRKEIGVTPRELTVPSPFDLRKQAILVVPRTRNRPGAPGFRDELSDGINEVLRTLGGQTMCLFTSYRNLEACADAAEQTGVNILRQGDKPRTKLLKQFRKDPGSALFATASFWQGVDIPGDALSCLIIDKLPFLPPDDPLVDALQERDPKCFVNYSLPKAILSLRQGVGRLIRTRTDRGAIVIFDHRLTTARYGQQFLDALPPCKLYRDLEEVQRFLGARTESGTRLVTREDA